MKANIEQLELIRRDLRHITTDTNLILIQLIDVELKRRRSVGRKKIDTDLLQRNREAARKYRETKKFKEEVKQHLAEKKRERHDKEMQKAGLMPKLKKKRTKNRQRWQKVPKVTVDRLHY